MIYFNRNVRGNRFLITVNGLNQQNVNWREGEEIYRPLRIIKETLPSRNLRSNKIDLQNLTSIAQFIAFHKNCKSCTTGVK